MKKVCVMLMMTLFCLSTFGFDIPKKPNPQRLVNDYIGLLQADQREILEKKLVDFDNKTSIQITIVILDDLDGAEASDVATEIGHSWGVGHKGIDNGIVFLIVKYNQNALEKLVTSKHGDYFIATGYGLEPYMTDYDVKDIGESHFIPYAKEDEYYEGITETVDAMIEHLGEIGWQQREELEAKRKAEREANIRAFFTITGLVLGGIALFALLIWLYVRVRNAYRKAQEIKKRRASLKKKFQEAKAEYEQLLSWIPNDISHYPTWAREKHHDFMHTVDRSIKSPAEGVFKDFPQCIETNLVRASQILSILTNIVPELEDIVGKFKDIPHEIKQYEKDALVKFDSAKESFETFRISIQVLKDKGFKLVEHENQLSGFKTSLDEISGKVQNLTERKAVYEASETLKEQISIAKQKMDNHVLCRKTTTESINALSNNITIVPEKMQAAQKVLEQLKKEHPKQNWEDLNKEFNSVAASFEKCKTLKKDAEAKNDMKTQDFEGAKRLMEDAEAKMESILGCFTDIHSRKEEIIAAKQGFKKAMAEAEKQIANAKSKMSDDDVESGAKSKLAEAEEKLEEAKKKSSGNMIDWLLLFALLITVRELADSSYSMAESDIEEAEQRRRRKKEEERRKKEEDERRKKREEESNNSYYSSHSHFGSGGFSGGGGSFGGFGGGGFGGGGAGGSW